MLDFVGKAIDLDKLAGTLPGYAFAHLITVDDDYHAHTTTITPAFDGAVFDIGPVGRHGRANLSRRSGVTLLFPAGRVDDYSLIVDGDAELPDDPAESVRVAPRRALLHRPAFTVPTGPREPADGPAFDCVQLTHS